ncbi:hypothetical protein EAS64_33645 [Trebonia kvetii]|uniref:Uncharacterized protein n=1 Tax=Trebonia kvetii TaxID=2480626 RepID=A0A6P2BSV2_9ACTN|nr:hypothetical protein [Trebonia kvetii]TVZ01225.1 hypothetical protein EAS64_33645 [Trebonia kvetii]
MSITETYDSPAALEAAVLPEPEEPLSVSFKTQRGTLISVRGRNAPEWADRLAMISAPIGEEGESVLDMIAAIDATLAGSSASSDSAPFNGGQQQQEVTPPCPDCGGRTEKREGTSKSTGKPYKGFFCSVNRDHKPNFVR